MLKNAVKGFQYIDARGPLVIVFVYIQTNEVRSLGLSSSCHLIKNGPDFLRISTLNVNDFDYRSRELEFDTNKQIEVSCPVR